MRKLQLLALLALCNFCHAAPGIIPAVSDHLQIKPVFVQFDQIAPEKITPGISRRFIMGTQSSLVRWDLKAGTTTPLHFHINEQITRVESGDMLINSQGTQYHLHPGDVMIFPPNVPHEFITLKDTVVYEYHTPGRQDFINGDFAKNLSAQKPASTR